MAKNKTIWDRSLEFCFYLWLILIVSLSIIPQNTHPFNHSFFSFFSKFMFGRFDLLQHIFGYCILAVLAFQVFKKNNIRLILFAVLFLGLVLEAVQYALPARTFDIYDLLANLTGVAIAWMLGGLRAFAPLREEKK